MPDTTFIYTLNDPRPGHRKAYVGKANDPFGRLHSPQGHLKDKNVNHRTCWIAGLKALGLEPILEILDEVPVAEWQFWEREWIRLYRALMFELVNGTDGGDGLGSGATHPSFGKPVSLEHRAKISAAQVGRIVSPETRAKISAAKMGHTVSSETRVRLSAAQTGKVASSETRAKISAGGRKNQG